MSEPRAQRPYMPGYGIVGPDRGGGLLPWSWAVERLTASKNYWVSTTCPDGRPHAMPVWAVWDRDALWFSSGGRSRKVRNIAVDPRCVVTTDDANDPVVVDGVAEVVTDHPALVRFIELTNAKYQAGLTVDFLDPAVNATIRVRPVSAFGLRHEDFTGSPTRWRFEADRPEGG